MIKVSKELRVLLNSGNAPAPIIKIKTGGHIFGFDDETDPENPVEQNDILSLNLHYAGADDDYPLGTAFSNYIDVELWNVDSDISLMNKATKVFVGYQIKNADDEDIIEWISAGTFFPEKPTRSGQVTSFTAYDRMKQLSKAYIPSFSANTAHTIEEYFSDIAKKFGFIFKSTSVPLAKTKINSSLFTSIASDDEAGDTSVNSYAAQSCIAYLAGAAGCNAMFNRNDELQLYGFQKAFFDEEKQYEVTDDNTDNPTVSEEDQRIQSVLCNNGETKLLSPSDGSGDTCVNISNPFITTQDHLDSVFTAITESKGVFAYRVIDLEHLAGDITLECFDTIKYTDAEGNSYQLPLMSLDFSYDGGLSCVMRSFGKTSSEAENEISAMKSMASNIEQLKSSNAALDKRISDATDSIMKASAGHVVMVDLEYNESTKKHYIGNGAPNTFVASLNPATATETESIDWNNGRLIRINHNGFAVSTSGIAGPYKDFAVYYNEQSGKYYTNADDIAFGTLTGIKISAVDITGTTIEGGTIKATTISGATINGTAVNSSTITGTTITGSTITGGTIRGATAEFDNARIGGFNIDDGKLTYKGALFADYDGAIQHFRTVIKGAHYNSDVDTAADTWVFGALEWRETDPEHIYKGRFIVYADGRVYEGRDFYLDVNAAIRSGNGMGAKNGAAILRCPSTGEIWLGDNFSFEGAYIQLPNIDSTTVYRYVERAKGGFIISANGGNNALYLQANTTHVLADFTIHGTAKFASGGAITSDARLKNSISNLADDSRYETLFNLLRPVSYKYNDGQSGRTHMGFIAQELKQALEEAGFTTKEIAAYVEFASEAEGLDGYECTIRYEEIIPMIVGILQKCFAKIFERQQK